MRWSISIHKALAGLDYCCPASCGIPRYFNPQGPRGPRPVPREGPMRPLPISIHKALAGLDHILSVNRWLESDFNPQGPRGPRRLRASGSPSLSYFNPQGPRGPRRRPLPLSLPPIPISIHKALAGLDTDKGWAQMVRTDFNPQGPRGPRQQNYPTIPPHPPNFLCIMSPPPPYFNLLHPFTQPIFTAFPLFFRCESPGHFMLAWHSHLV